MDNYEPYRQSCVVSILFVFFRIIPHFKNSNKKINRVTDYHKHFYIWYTNLFGFGKKVTVWLVVLQFSVNFSNSSG